MGIYVFNKNILIDCLEENKKKKDRYDFGQNILPDIIGGTKHTAINLTGIGVMWALLNPIGKRIWI
jgi:ADP-glucose pyrophosphorylase